MRPPRFSTCLTVLIFLVVPSLGFAQSDESGTVPPPPPAPDDIEEQKSEQKSSDSSESDSSGELEIAGPSTERDEDESTDDDAGEQPPEPPTPESVESGSSTRSGRADAPRLEMADDGDSGGKRETRSFPRYDERFLHLAYMTDRSSTSEDWDVAYRGTQRTPLEPEEFYRRVGHADYAREYRRKTTWKTTLMISSGVTMSAGIVLAYAANFVGEETRQQCLRDGGGFVECDERFREAAAPVFLWGGGVFLGGAIIGTVGILLDTHPISRREALDLAREHNRSLRQEFDVPDDYEPLAATGKTEPRLRFGLSPQSDGVAGMLRVDF